MRRSGDEATCTWHGGAARDSYNPVSCSGVVVRFAQPVLLTLQVAAACFFWRMNFLITRDICMGRGRFTIRVHS